MTLNHQKSENYVPGNSRKDSVYIKFGKVHYRIQYDQIAYLYKIEGIFFLVDMHKHKLPLFMDSLDDFPLNLSSKSYFKLSDTVIVNRDAVTIANGMDRNIAIASNSMYKNKFEIPRNLENDFRFWLLNP